MLSAHVAQVDPAALSRPRSLRGSGWGEAIAAIAGDDPRSARQALGDSDVDAIDQARLVRICGRDDQSSQSDTCGGLGDSEGAARWTHAAVERELAEQGVPGEALAIELDGRCEHGAREREIERGACLGHVARREIRGHAPGGELEAGVEDRRVHALARLRARLRRQAQRS